MAWHLVSSKPLSEPLCWNIINWTLGNKLQWNSIRNTKLFIHENAFEIVVYEIVAILLRGWWLNVAQIIACQRNFAGCINTLFSAWCLRMTLHLGVGIYSHVVHNESMVERRLSCSRTCLKKYELYVSLFCIQTVLSYLSWSTLQTSEAVFGKNWNEK